MKHAEVFRRYHDVWNGRDADALVAIFTKDGTFCNPDTYPGASGEALAAYVKGLWTAFPDWHLETLNAGEIESGLIIHLLASLAQAELHYQSLGHLRQQNRRSATRSKALPDCLLMVSSLRKR
jgi:hypothetical protein